MADIGERAAVHLLTLNPGSSSLKAGLYRMDSGEQREIAVIAERIGASGSRLAITDDRGVMLLDRQEDLPDHTAALQSLIHWLRAERGNQPFAAIGHRVVYGGPRYREPQRITPEMVAALQELTAIDPEHLPQALGIIAAVGEAFPDLPQIACFDTAFHRTMPPVAQHYALPPEYATVGIIRYGFHGLSYEYIMDALRTEDPAGADGRVVIAHLGNGASMAAVRGGVGIETTMGFSPTGGLVMGTRTGDLDPSVPLYLVGSRGMAPGDVTTLFNKQAGMRGVSGTSGDMRDLLEREANDPRAAEAVALFCYAAKKYLGALAAALGGLDTLVFTGGIGEHAPAVRARMCADLAFLGIALDPKRNDAHAAVISRDGAGVVVRVIPTDEDLVIARHTYHLITNGETHDIHV